jgi:hypothetical protein
MSMLAIEGSVTHKWTSVDDAGYANAVQAFDETVGRHTHWAETVTADGTGDLTRALDPAADLTLVHLRLVGG